MTPSKAREMTAHAHGVATRLHSHRLVVVRVLWLILVGLLLVMLVVALPAYYEAYRTIASPEPQVSGQLSQDDVRVMEEVGISLDVYATFQTAQIAFVSLVFTTAGALLFWRKPTDRMVVFISVWFMLLAPIGSPLLDPLIRVHPAWELPVRGLQGATMGCLPIFTYMFPDGRFVPRWTRTLTLFWIVWLVLAPFTPFAIGDFAGPSVLWFAVLLPGGMVIGILAQVYRYRRVSTKLEQQQVKWVLFGFGVVALGLFLYSLVPLVFPSVLVPGLPKLLFELLSGPVLIVLPLCLLPLCIGLAILRSRLWDIDHLINRTLVYGALSAGIAGLYIVLVVALGALFARGEPLRGNVVIGLLATGLVAFLIQPLRERLQHSVNRLMYGERDDPYAVLSRLSQHLKTTLVPSAVLPTIAETIAQALKLPYVALALAQGDRLEIAAAYGRASGEYVHLPLVYQSETIGQLLVAPRAPGETFTPAERQLLDDIALQAGIAAHAVRLTADLQRSREQLIMAREEERRRLRRDLHDGLGPQLASLTLTIAATRELLRQDPDVADKLLQELAIHAQGAITDVRRVVYALRPPALDDLGLVLALREHVALYTQSGVQITVDAHDHLPALPAAVEVAAYRIVQEALTNTIRHAQARTCTVRLTLGDALEVEIRDDGVGLLPGCRGGIGLASMRERTDELGGTCEIVSVPGAGTCIQVRLPLYQEGTWTASAS